MSGRLTRGELARALFGFLVIACAGILSCTGDPPLSIERLQQCLAPYTDSTVAVPADPEVELNVRRRCVKEAGF